MPHTPQPLSDIQKSRLQTFIATNPPISLSIFWSKWDLSREDLARLCYIDIRTLNRYLSRGSNQEEARPVLDWYLSLVNLIIERFDELPDDFKSLFNE